MTLGHTGVSIFQEGYFEGAGLVCTAVPYGLILVSLRMGPSPDQEKAGAP